MYRRTVQTTLKASYTSHYRRGLIKLLDVLGSVPQHRSPAGDRGAVPDTRYAAGRLSYYPVGEGRADPPRRHRRMGGSGVRQDQSGATRGGPDGLRSVHAQALRDRLRCKEVWVAGADKWRNPDQDLPADFDDKREEHFRQLNKPLHARRSSTNCAMSSKPELASP